MQWKGRHMCGATLVKNSEGRFWGISAAHCFFSCAEKDDEKNCIRFTPDDKDDWTMHCGIHNLTGDSPSHEQKFNIKALMNHEQYRPLGPDYPDISVLELDRQPVENQWVQAACLAARDHQVKEGAYIAGWGALEEGGGSPDVLHEVYKPIDSDDYCEKIYEKYQLDTDVQKSFCAGHRGGGKDSCQGDSGGPLYTHRGGRWALTGVVSWGEGCANKGFVGVYADVYSLRKWINSKINN